MTTLHGIEIKVGDKVWDYVTGWSKITVIQEKSPFPIEVHRNLYTQEGLFLTNDKFPRLFWQEFEIPAHAFVKPKVMVKKYIVVYKYSGNYLTTENRYNKYYASKEDFEDSSSILDYLGGTNVYKFISLILESEIEVEE